MCYLLAASDLQVSPGDCLVFEDSFAGIEAATKAGMRVIALSTTNPAGSLRDKAYTVIPDFEGITFDQFLQWR
jgi:beta-phosphoglucomutase-like phosphatase (HAD superfamily)